MAGNSLQIDDDYCKTMGDYFVQEGNEIEGFISEYVVILERIKSNAIIKGDVANALGSYIEYTKKLKGKISGISTASKQQTGKFLASVDNADLYLF